MAVQVSNWFINARVRLWKPMMEEIHNLEMRQVHKHPPHDKGQQHGVHGQSHQHSSQQPPPIGVSRHLA